MATHHQHHQVCDMDWDCWYDLLSTLARKYKKKVSDKTAWHEEYEKGSWPEEAFYAEYPEHAP